MADPSVLYDSLSRKFYVYGTADNWDDGKGVRYIPIASSDNLTDWMYFSEAFSKITKPNWQAGGIWAPDVVKVNDNFHLYYSISKWGDLNPSIGVAIGNSPLGPFYDKGRIFSSQEIDVPNSIDPFYFEDNGKKYLFWGSFSSSLNQGTYGIELSPDGLEYINKESKFKIAAGDWEAVVIHKRGNYYYMFGSKGSCCEGANSSYHVLVARSINLKGPYLDKDGHDISIRGNGTLILEGNSKIVGPGHTSRIMTDLEGQDWILYHGIQSNRPILPNNTNRRCLFMDKVNWKDDWPIINDGTPSITNRIGPKF